MRDGADLVMYSHVIGKSTFWKSRLDGIEDGIMLNGIDFILW